MFSVFDLENPEVGEACQRTSWNCGQFIVGEVPENIFCES